MSELIRQTVAIIRDQIEEAKAEVASLRAELKEVQGRCTHPEVEMLNNHGYERIYTCKVCGKSW